jgi:hypothetical protein
MIHERWFTSDGQKRRAAVVAELRALRTLEDLDLRGIDLRGVALPAARLVGARLDDAFLDGADFTAANLSCTSLRRATLRGTTLVGATLGSADARAADLTGARLLGCDLEGADITCVRRARRGLHFERAIAGGWPTFTDLAPLYMAAMRAQPVAMRAIEAARDASPAWSRELAALLSGLWREHMLAALAIALYGADAPLVRQLWSVAPTSFACPQLLAAAACVDPDFEGRARRLARRGDTREKARAALEALLERELDRQSGGIPVHWRELVTARRTRPPRRSSRGGPGSRPR